MAHTLFEWYRMSPNEALEQIFAVEPLPRAAVLRPFLTNNQGNTQVLPWRLPKDLRPLHSLANALESRAVSLDPIVDLVIYYKYRQLMATLSKSLQLSPVQRRLIGLLNSANGRSQGDISKCLRLSCSQAEVEQMDLIATGYVYRVPKGRFLYSFLSPVTKTLISKGRL